MEEVTDMKAKTNKFNIRSRKGMTLVELLIGIAVASVIMVATIVLVNYSFSAYSTTHEQISKDAGLYDTTDIVNRYIREAEFCSVKDDTTLYISISNYSVGGVTLGSTDIRFIYDEPTQTLLLDKMDGTPALTIANYITDIQWEVYSNGVRYKMVQKPVLENDETVINGFAYCRGR
jgi:prepilin-type N-terminal cleavage/methylation domain-containing protein